MSNRLWWLVLGWYINVPIYCQSTYSTSILICLMKYQYIAFIQYCNLFIACISCIYVVPVSLICGQLFGVKSYSCVSLFYACYCTILTPIPPTTQYIDLLTIWIYARLQHRPSTIGDPTSVCASDVPWLMTDHCVSVLPCLCSTRASWPRWTLLTDMLWAGSTSSTNKQTNRLERIWEGGGGTLSLRCWRRMWREEHECGPGNTSNSTGGRTRNVMWQSCDSVLASCRWPQFLLVVDDIMHVTGGCQTWISLCLWLNHVLNR